MPDPAFHMPHLGLPCNEDCGGVAPGATSTDGHAYFTLRVRLDPLPGAFHTPDSALDAIRGILNQHIPHYNPKVSLEL